MSCPVRRQESSRNTLPLSIGRLRPGTPQHTAKCITPETSRGKSDPPHLLSDVLMDAVPTVAEACGPCKRLEKPQTLCPTCGFWVLCGCCCRLWRECQQSTRMSKTSFVLPTLLHSPALHYRTLMHPNHWHMWPNPGHESTDTELAYTPVSQAYGPTQGVRGAKTSSQEYVQTLDPVRRQLSGRLHTNTQPHTKHTWCCCS